MPNDPDQRPVVIIGAGFAGLHAAQYLGARGLPVVLVDRQNHHVFQPLLYQVASAGLSPADIASPIRSIMRRFPSVRVVMEEVVGVDRGARRVVFANGMTLEYATLVIATGARHGYFGRSDWSAHAPGIKTINDALRVRHDLLIALEWAESMRASNHEVRAEHLTFVVVGGGPTGVELAGAIAELARHTAEREYPHITRKCVRVLLVDSGPRVLKAFPERLSAAATRSLASLGVELRLQSRVTDVGAGYILIGNERVNAAVTVWAAGVAASPAGEWLKAPTDPQGRVIVTERLTLTDDPSVFVLGDTAAVLLSDGNHVPGTAAAAKQMGVYAGRAILARYAGRQSSPFRYRHAGNMATIGRSRAVAELGRFRIADHAAWLLWCTVHIWFLIGFRSRLVVGLTWLWNYLTFERTARLITRSDVPPR